VVAGQANNLELGFDTRYTLSEEGIRYVTHRDRAQLPTTRGIWSTELIKGQPRTAPAPGSPHRDLGQADPARRRGDLVPVGASGGSAGNNCETPRTGVWKDQPSIGHQAVIVEGDVDTIGALAW